MNSDMFKILYLEMQEIRKDLNKIWAELQVISGRAVSSEHLDGHLETKTFTEWAKTRGES